MAVVLYHVDDVVAPGGFVGVDLFFVLSGYLITTLLLVERERSGSISIRGFWGRRVRRLWPLAWLTLSGIAVASLTGVWGPDRQRSLPAELASAFGQVANWYQVGHGGYVHAVVAPSPIQHFWSLAIEEQFYAVWPLLLAGVLLLSAARQRWIVPAALGTMAGASVVAGWHYAASPDRAYLGTDVRFVALVIGAALAWTLRNRPMEGPRHRAGRASVAAAGSLGVIGLGVAVVALHADSPWLPRSGYMTVALAGGAVVAFALLPTAFSSALSWKPLVGLGRISYGVYLIHWPLLVALGPGRSDTLRLLVGGPCTVLIALALHRLVERPIIARRIPWPRVAGATVAVVAVSVLALALSVPSGRTPSELVAASLNPVRDPTTTSAPSVATTSAPCPPPDAVPLPQDGISPSERSVADPAAGMCHGQIKVLVVGDSTGRGAANGLVSLGDQRIAVWDRTVLGCSFGGEKCPDWRSAWQLDVQAIHPNVVVVFSGVVSDLRGVNDSAFLSTAESNARATQLDEAIGILSSGGAKVILTLPPVPLRPNGLFFCDGKAGNSNCDPVWVRQWSEDIRHAASRSGSIVVDIAAWAAARGSTLADRPDGLHFGPTALHDEAIWLDSQIVAASS